MGERDIPEVTPLGAGGNNGQLAAAVVVELSHEGRRTSLDTEGEKLCAGVSSVLLALEANVGFVEFSENEVELVLFVRIVAHGDSIDGYNTRENIAKDISLDVGRERRGEGGEGLGDERNEGGGGLRKYGNKKRDREREE